MILFPPRLHWRWFGTDEMRFGGAIDLEPGRTGVVLWVAAYGARLEIQWRRCDVCADDDCAGRPCDLEDADPGDVEPV